MPNIPGVITALSFLQKWNWNSFPPKTGVPSRDNGPVLAAVNGTGLGLQVLGGVRWGRPRCGR